MKKTFIALLALAGVAVAADHTNYTYVGASEGWAESASNWQDENGKKLGDSGLLNQSSNSGKVSGSTFTISDTQTVKAGHNTGGFSGATVNIAKGGILQIDDASAVYGKGTTVEVGGTLVVNKGKALGHSDHDAAKVNVRAGGVLDSQGNLGRVEITLEKGAEFIAHDDLKLKDTTLTLEDTLRLGETYLDSNANTGSATFNLGGNGKVEFGVLHLNSAGWGMNTYTLSAGCTDGYMSGDGDVVLFERTLMSYSSLSGGTEDELLSHIVGGKITLGDKEMTQIAENAVFDGAALTGENVGQYRFLIEDNQIKLQYAAYLIPEPTTATLSLLALAGLAARRRRK